MDLAVVDRIIAECRAHSAGIQRPDKSQLERLERDMSSLTRKIEFHMRNTGETTDDEREIAETLRNLRRERKALRDQLAMIRAATLESVQVRSRDEVISFVDNLSEILGRAAAGQVGGCQDAARDILALISTDC